MVLNETTTKKIPPVNYSRTGLSMISDLVMVSPSKLILKSINYKPKRRKLIKKVRLIGSTYGDRCEWGGTGWKRDWDIHQRHKHIDSNQNKFYVRNNVNIQCTSSVGNWKTVLWGATRSTKYSASKLFRLQMDFCSFNNNTKNKKHTNTHYIYIPGRIYNYLWFDCAFRAYRLLIFRQTTSNPMLI